MDTRYAAAAYKAAGCIIKLQARYQHSMGRTVKHAGKTTLYLTPMHAAIDKLLALTANIRAALTHVRAVTEQLPQADRRKTFLE